MGWAQLQNGELLREAETAFDAFITTDKNIKYEQNPAGRRLAILVLPTTSWPIIQRHVGEVIAAIGAAQPGELCEIVFDP